MISVSSKVNGVEKEQTIYNLDSAIAATKLPERTKQELKALTTMPEALENAQVVGVWLWIPFPSKPSADCRSFLKARGYRFNPQRSAWQNACGVYTRRAPYDPREKYGQESAVAVTGYQS